MSTLGTRLFVVGLWLATQINVSGEEILKIKRITGPVEFDGIPNEEAWQSLDLFNLTMHKPNYMAQPSEESDIRIGYDNEFLWIGASWFMNDA